MLYTQWNQFFSKVKNTKTAQTNLFIDASREPLTNLFELEDKQAELSFRQTKQHSLALPLKRKWE